MDQIKNAEGELFYEMLGKGEKTANATKFLNIRSTNNPNLVKPYNFETFEDEKDMFFTESVDLYNLEYELTRVEKNLKKNNKIVAIKIYLGYQFF